MGWGRSRHAAQLKRRPTHRNYPSRCITLRPTAPSALAAAPSPPGVLSGLSRSKGGAKSPQDSEARDRVGEMRPFDFPAAGPGGAGRKAAAPVEQRLHSAVTGMAGAHPLLQAGALGASQRRRAPGSPGALSPRSPGGTPAPRPAGDVELGAAGAAGAAGANNVNGGAVLKRLRTSLAGRRGGGGDGDAGAEQGRKGRPRERVPKPLTQAELRRMREAVAIKTFSALVHRWARGAAARGSAARGARARCGG